MPCCSLQIANFTTFPIPLLSAKAKRFVFDKPLSLALVLTLWFRNSQFALEFRVSFSLMAQSYGLQATPFSLFYPL